MSTLTLPGVDEILLALDVVTEDERAVLVEWAADRHRRGRLLTNPQDPLTHLTPFLAADGRLTEQVRPGSAGDGPAPVWVPRYGAELLDPLPPEFWLVRSRVVDVFGLHGVPDDPYKGSFLNIIEPGGRVVAHRDARLRTAGGESLALRCNVLFSKTAAGGIPTIADREIDVPERAAWIFYASEHPHSASPVIGEPGEFRGALSYGFRVAPDLPARRQPGRRPGVYAIAL